MPRAKRPVIATVMAAFAGLVLVGYAAVAFTQREFGTAEHQQVPPSVRSSPGGYRSYAFWHSGYHGGK